MKGGQARDQRNQFQSLYFIRFQKVDVGLPWPCRYFLVQLGRRLIRSLLLAIPLVGQDKNRFFLNASSGRNKLSHEVHGYVRFYGLISDKSP
jgi:hypothetical protein